MLSDRKRLCGNMLVVGCLNYLRLVGEVVDTRCDIIIDLPGRVQECLKFNRQLSVPTISKTYSDTNLRKDYI